MPVELTGLGGPGATITLDAPERLNAFSQQDLRDLSDALDLADLLRQHRVGGIEQRGDRQVLGGEGQDQHRESGRIRLPISR